MVGTVEPAIVSVFVAFQAIGIHHECARRNEVAGGRPGHGRQEIFFTFNGSDLIFPGMR